MISLYAYQIDKNEKGIIYMIHLQEHYYTILTFGTKYKSLYNNDHTIYTNTLNIHR